jgi:hypothetical protein|tara:strand:- start:1533 stop:1772 length:240 start_codon:yes stop_codon:yes gene_type:complete
MPYKGKLDGKAIETSVSIALENAFNEYIELNRRTIDWQSQLSAFKARKVLQKIKDLAHRRKLELLTLYSIDPKRLKKIQ